MSIPNGPPVPPASDGLTLGGLTNDGEFFATSGLTVNGGLVNNGTYSGGNVSVNKGDLTNNGTFHVDFVVAPPSFLDPAKSP